MPVPFWRFGWYFFVGFVVEGVAISGFAVFPFYAKDFRWRDELVRRSRICVVVCFVRQPRWLPVNVSVFFAHGPRIQVLVPTGSIGHLQFFLLTLPKIHTRIVAGACPG